MDNNSAVAMHPYQPVELEQPVVVSAIFSASHDAQAAVRELREVGIPADSISLISRDEDTPAALVKSGAAGVSYEDIGDEAMRSPASPDLPSNQDIYANFPNEPGRVNLGSPVAVRAAGLQKPMENRAGTAVGAGLGSLAGLLVGMATPAIPGVGPFIAAGSLAVALSGLVAGGAVGGIVGALSAIGVPEEYAYEYATRIEQGHTLISVSTDDLTQDLVERVLVANGGDDVSET